MSRAASPIYQLGAGSRPARRPARPQLPAGHSLKPRLAVLAPSTAEVVRFAGGWLVDQGLAAARVPGEAATDVEVFRDLDAPVAAAL